MAPPRQRKIEYREDPKARSTTRGKRRNGLFKRTGDFHVLTGDPVALVTIDPKGKCRCVCEPSIPEMISTYHRLVGDVMWMEGWGEWLDWAEKVCNSCQTKKHCDSWSRKCLAFLRCLHEKSKDLENNPPVSTGAGDDSRAPCADIEDVFTGLGDITILPDVDSLMT